MATVDQLRECLTPNPTVLKTLVAVYGSELESIIRNQRMNQLEVARCLVKAIRDMSDMTAQQAWDLVFGAGSYDKFLSLPINQ